MEGGAVEIIQAIIAELNQNGFVGVPIPGGYHIIFPADIWIAVEDGVLKVASDHETKHWSLADPESIDGMLKHVRRAHQAN
jgi:hypothetical protein